MLTKPDVRYVRELVCSMIPRLSRACAVDRALLEFHPSSWQTSSNLLSSLPSALRNSTWRSVSLMPFGWGTPRSLSIRIRKASEKFKARP